jgi:hypothetical protein
MDQAISRRQDASLAAPGAILNAGAQIVAGM